VGHQPEWDTKGQFLRNWLSSIEGSVAATHEKARDIAIMKSLGLTVEWLPMREEDQMNHNQRGQLALDGLQKLMEPSHKFMGP
jgi:hypothetical protein